MTKKNYANLTAGFWLVAMLALWITFAPTQAGGLASYILVVGNSMEPNFHIGDLVIVHEEAQYQIGDAVVYRNLELGNFVFHRIIGETLGRFTLQGDNNPWTDTYQPSKDEVLGKLWIHIPMGGRALEKIRNPYGMAGIAGILGGILASGFFTDKSKARRRMNKGQFTTLKEKIRDWLTTLKQKLVDQLTKLDGDKSPFSSKEPHLETLIFGLGLVAFTAFIIGIASFSRPATRIVQNDISYKQLGTFTYATPASALVYDANTLQSGDPIFPKLTCSVELAFQYTLIAQQAEDIAGTIQLMATISEPLSGWHRTIPLQKETVFSGSSVSATAELNLCKIEKLTQSLEQGADVHPGSYTLTISPNVKVKGVIARRNFESAFNTGLEFRYDRIQFYLLTDEEDKEKNLLHAVETGVLSESQTQANVIKVLGMEFAVPALRWIAILGLIISLSGLAFLGKRLQNISQNDPIQFNRIKFNTVMVDVQNSKTLNVKTAVEVTSMDDLSKLAEKFNTLILHVAHDRSHTYYVQGEGTTYCFIINTEKTANPNISEKENRDPL